MKLSLLKKFIFTIFVLSPFMMPIISFAQVTNTGLALQCNGTATSTDASGVQACDFNALIDTGTHLIEWMFYVSVPIMVALLAYCGILYMTGVEKNISKAKDIFIKVAGGFTVMLIAFVVVSTLIGWVGNSTFTTTSGGSSSNAAVFLNGN